MLARLTKCTNAELAIGHQIRCNRAVAAQPFHQAETVVQAVVAVLAGAAQVAVDHQGLVTLPG